MQFLSVLMGVAGIAIGATLGFRLYAWSAVVPGRRTDWALDAAAVVVTIIMLVLLGVRSLGFGVDTAGYVQLFKGHCLGLLPADTDLSYSLAMGLLDSATGGICNVDLLPLAWGLTFVLILFLAPASLAFKFRYTALLLVSMVGIELTTNALRQGLSVATFVVGVAAWQRHKGYASGLFVLSAVLHESALLVVGAFFLSQLNTWAFLAGLGAAVLVVGYIVVSGSVLNLLAPFLYEITKYMAHEADEIYVRLLAAACLGATVVLPVMVSGGRDRRVALISSSEFGMAMKLSITTIPFLFLPYFGYRYIYAVMPIALWFMLVAAERSGISSGRVVAVVGAANMSILLVWSGGSSYMRQVLFLQL